MMRVLILVISLICFNVQADEDEHVHEHSHEKEQKQKDDHGHDEKEKEEAIELSPEAVKNFGIKVEKIVSKAQKAEIPLSAIVDSKDKKQIFIFHAGKYEVRDVKIIKRSPTSVTVDSFGESEDVVTSGVNYLKVVEMSHGEEGGGGHGH